METIQLIIGVTGIIGSGKTTVCKHYENLGYKVIYTDILAKELIENNLEIRNKIKKEFGELSYIDGTYNSKYISSIVFNNNLKLDKLNQIVHPFVLDKIINLCEEKFKIQENSEENNTADMDRIIFVESALMFETGSFEGYDYIITVDCPEELVIERNKLNQNFNEENFKNRLKTQFSNSKKVSLADFVISNKGNKKALIDGADFILEIIKTLPPNQFEEEDV